MHSYFRDDVVRQLLAKRECSVVFEVLASTCGRSYARRRRGRRGRRRVLKLRDDDPSPNPQALSS